MVIRRTCRWAEESTKFSIRRLSDCLQAFTDASLSSFCQHSHIHCTFIGGYFEKGAWPCANSNAVIPKDQISALSNTRKKTKWELSLGSHYSGKEQTSYKYNNVLSLMQSFQGRSDIHTKIPYRTNA